VFRTFRPRLSTFRRSYVFIAQCKLVAKSQATCGNVIPKSYFIARYKTLPQGPAVAEGCWYLANKSFAASQNIGEIGYSRRSPYRELYRSQRITPVANAPTVRIAASKVILLCGCASTS
jgi:hypothetical protein